MNEPNYPQQNQVGEVASQLSTLEQLCLVGLEPALIEGERRFINNNADQTTHIDKRVIWLGEQSTYRRAVTSGKNGFLSKGRASIAQKAGFSSLRHRFPATLLSVITCFLVF